MPGNTHLLVAAASLAVVVPSLPVAAKVPTGIKNIVLVHGAFVDGSGWKPIVDILQKDGYTVSVVQPPETSLDDDVAATNRILDLQDGPVVLVGHSYGGAIITEAGNNLHVKTLVYVAAFQPDVGESIAKLGGSNPPAGKPLTPTKDGVLFIEPALFHADFGADMTKSQADFMAISQVGLSLKAATAEIKPPAWKSKSSYAIVATQDRSINPDLERSMFKVELHHDRDQGRPRRLHLPAPRGRGCHRKGPCRPTLTSSTRRFRSPRHLGAIALQGTSTCRVPSIRPNAPRGS